MHSLCARKKLRVWPLESGWNCSVQVEQPAGLYTLAQRYAEAAGRFIGESAAAGQPFLLYLPFNHIHGPNSCSASSCGQSIPGLQMSANTHNRCCLY